jgi:hypothetical protein
LFDRQEPACVVRRWIVAPGDQRFGGGRSSG